MEKALGRQDNTLATALIWIEKISRLIIKIIAKERDKDKKLEQLQCANFEPYGRPDKNTEKQRIKM